MASSSCPAGFNTSWVAIQTTVPKGIQAASSWVAVQTVPKGSQVASSLEAALASSQGAVHLDTSLASKEGTSGSHLD